MVYQTQKGDNAMSEQAIFRSQIGGFNKDEVLRYIDDLNSKNAEEMKQSQAAVEEITAELNENRDKRVELEGNFKELMDTYEELRQHYLTLKERCENLESSNEKLRARCQKYDKELTELREENETLSKKVKKSKKTIGHLTEMNDGALEVMSAAKASAEGLIYDAKESVAGLNGDIDRFCGDVMKTRSFVKDSMEAMLKRLDCIAEEAGGVKIDPASIDEVSAEIGERAEDAQKEVNQKLDKLKEKFFR